MAKHYPVEQRERAVKMVLDLLGEYRSVYAACQSIGPKVGGVGVESLRRWVLQAQVDTAQRPDVTTDELSVSASSCDGAHRKSPGLLVEIPHL